MEDSIDSFPKKSRARENDLEQIYPYLSSFPEEQWIDLLQNEEEDHVMYKLINESCEAARKLEESQNFDKRVFSFVTMCCHMAWMKIINLQFMRIDPGEESENFEEKWQADSEPPMSHYVSDFSPIPEEFVLRKFGSKSNLCSFSEIVQSNILPKNMNKNNIRTEPFANMSVETNEIEPSTVRSKMKIAPSKTKSALELPVHSKEVPIDSIFYDCEWYQKERMRRIPELSELEKRLVRVVDKYPENVMKEIEAEYIEMENRENLRGIRNSLICDNMDEKIAFIRKLPEHERRYFLPYLPLINEFLEADENVLIKFFDCSGELLDD